MTSAFRKPGRFLLDRTWLWGVAGVLLSWNASAQTGLRVRWTAPDECPQRQQLLELVRDVAGPAYPGRASVQARGVISAQEGGYSLELEVSEGGRSQRRHIEAKECSDLTGAAAVILGLELQRAAEPPVGATEPGNGGQPPAPDGTPAVDAPSSIPPSGPERSPTPPAKPSPAVSEGPVSEAPIVASPPVEDPDDQPQGQGRTHLFLGLPLVSVSLGALPTPGFGAGAAVGLRVGAWGFSAMGRYELPRPAGALSVPNVGARVRAQAVQLSVFRAWRTGALEVAPGLSVAGSLLQVRGTGADVNPATARTQAIHVGADLTFRLFATDAFAVGAMLSARIAGVRPRIMIESLGEVRRFGPGDVLIVLGPEWNF
jgi:hypothetical protein